MNITDTTQIENATIEQLKAIDKALVAAAYEIKKNVQNTFVNNGRYTNINKLADGIMLGKLQNSSIKLHAFGYNDIDKQTYIARFFVGGTKERIQKKRKGKSIKPFSKGKIDALNSIDKGLIGAETILHNYIQKSLE